MNYWLTFHYRAIAPSLPNSTRERNHPLSFQHSTKRFSRPDLNVQIAWKCRKIAPNGVCTVSNREVMAD
ncbi:hypothetical protein [Anabaena sp. CCY 9910]|uniref:hypothetical protein n=1 Tax=Anabaena sp. CCY 9910 TaxID=3103870 RepID=UPI0039E1906F